MLNLSANLQIYLCTVPTDMRKSFDGLSAMITSKMEKDLLSGHLFLFVNRRRDYIKLIYWDRDGTAIWYKRLEAGTFELPPADGNEACLEIDSTDLALLLNGVSLGSAKLRKRFSMATE
jgi:transposase